ncbi:transcriptional repressor LexA [Planctomicrobium piriforme]|uniref:LexA repressor n=1 Tax=Planctomicrobium piriforme TaxID=1576369 RepID=A0A1I3FZG0_9PLAN|nr:transcriptional repressor LexA [Planctomicrobium piriforme]SFI16432.1 repressor LexA [Planctomicrobium piriforme]
MVTEQAKLTKRQHLIYEFIKDLILNRGYGPTVREIGLHFGIRSPNGVMCHLKALEKKGLITREQNMSRAIQLTESIRRGKTSLPFAGQIAAGTPVLAVEDRERMEFSDLFEDNELFCLRVRGDSMVEDHITDGDYAIIRRQPTARDGEIVAALVDGEDATLKRFYREASRFRLEPANSSMKPIYSDNVEILGVLQSVIRRY